MTFAAPLWLAAFIPLVALAIWLLAGRRRDVTVPFVPLWLHAPQPSHSQPRLLLPPLFISLLLAAVAVSVLAAARPQWGRGGDPLTIIVDRGRTMSAQTAGTERYKQVVRQWSGPIERALGNRQVRLIPVPGDEQWTDVSHTAELVAALPSRWIDTTDRIHEALRAALDQSTGPVLLFSDQQSGISDARLLQFAPDQKIHNAGIVSMSARDEPRCEVMVRIANTDASRPEHLHVHSGQASAEQDIALPDRGAADFFIDLPTLSQVIQADLDSSDDVSADNHAWLCRQHAGARIEASGNLPEPLRRMIAVYGAHRTTTSDADAVLITTIALPSHQSGAVISDSTDIPAAGQQLHATAHPVLNQLDVEKVPWGPPLDAASLAGWTPIVSRGDGCVVAIRDSDARQVWISADVERWAHDPSFVVFWANVLDWLGGPEEWQARPLEDLSPAWTPANGSAAGAAGIYHRGTSQTAAFNCRFVSEPPRIGSGNAQVQLERLARMGGQQRSMAGMLAICGAVLVAAAVFVMGFTRR